ncbi:MAG: hypothetical protein JST04_13365 [Bdellovibrionales bacterium]|nr:hypothetical protein [Bdellovibrionales bacterium]
MAKHALKREERDAAKNGETKAAVKAVSNEYGSRISPRKNPERRASDRGHAGQLLWSFAVAICLILAALLQWTAPKNALMEQDRAPAQIRFETTANSSLNGS